MITVALVCPRCDDMHRRAQAAESKASKVVRQNDHARLWRTVAELKRQADHQSWRAAMWKDRWRTLKTSLLAGAPAKEEAK